MRISGLEISTSAATSLLGYPSTGGVVLHPKTLELIEFDSTGMVFWRALRQSSSREDAVTLLCVEFNAEPDQINRDLHTFADHLDRLGLVGWPTRGEPAHSTVTAVIACHNRRELTIACLESLFAAVPSGWKLSVVLVDDGSTDGTSAAVAALDRPVRIVRGTGSWFWSRSMAEGEQIAEASDPDVILWLNDDVRLDPSALTRALACHEANRDDILVGAMWDSVTANVSFTGFVHDQGGKGRSRRVAPTTELLDVDSFHGNFVVVPRSARVAIGPIDGSWPHHYADLDYAERARESAVRMRLLPGLVGQCRPETAPWLNPDATPFARLRSVLGRKGWPLSSQFRFARRHSDALRWQDSLGVYTSAITGSAARKPPALSALRSRLNDSTELSGSLLPASWRPHPAADLIRLGPARDGGYVVSKASIMASKAVVSGGLGFDWAFEEALRTLNPVPVTVYDGTMGPLFWLSPAETRSGCLEGSPQALARLNAYRHYRRFFAQRGVSHIERNLGPGVRHTVSMSAALAAAGQEGVFVKLDVEGGEYDLLGALVEARERITGLVIEMHAIDAFETEISRFVQRMDTHVVTFVRANNAASTNEQGRATVLEMSWVRRDLFRPASGCIGSSLEYLNDPNQPRLSVDFAPAS